MIRNGSEMLKVMNFITNTPIDAGTSKDVIVKSLENSLLSAGYDIVECNDQKPWGAYLRIDGEQSDRFVEQFFPGLSLKDAKLGLKDVELSPKFLVVSPGARLSWQLHHRRAERWMFLTNGGYHRSKTDDQGEMLAAQAGDVVQFMQGERHRLVGDKESYSVVAEIWQHTDRSRLSDEDDIVRVDDDYLR